MKQLFPLVAAAMLGMLPFMPSSEAAEIVPCGEDMSFSEDEFQSDSMKPQYKCFPAEEIYVPPIQFDPSDEDSFEDIPAGLNMQQAKEYLEQRGETFKEIDLYGGSVATGEKFDPPSSAQGAGFAEKE